MTHFDDSAQGANAQLGARVVTVGTVEYIGVR